MSQRLMAVICLALSLVWASAAVGQGGRNRPRQKPAPARSKPVTKRSPKPAPALPETGSPKPFTGLFVAAPTLLSPPLPSAPLPPPLLQKDETPFAGASREIVLRATLSRGEFKTGNLTSPTWKVTLVVQNGTDQTLELGESLMVIETIKNSPVYLSNYLTRERAEPVERLRRARERYLLLWGYEVDPKGTALIPFLALQGLVGSSSQSFMDLFLATLTSPRVETYEGLGYGQVSPHAERRLETEIVAPLGLKLEREEIAVVLPSFRPLGPPAGARTYTVCRFLPALGYRPLETVTVTTGVAELTATVENADLPLWRRIFALNWLAEEHLGEAEGLLLRLAAEAKENPALRNAAILNLGAWQIKAAVAPLLGVLESAAEENIRGNAIEALGDIGDRAAVAKLRPYLDHANEGVGTAAITALGKLKDAESVAALSAILLDKKKEARHEAGAAALGAIGDEAAISTLTSCLGSEKTGERLRLQIISALGAVGGPQALAAVSRAAESRSENTREAALRALLKMPDAGAADRVVTLAARPDYASQMDALRLLSGQAVESARPAMRRLVADKTAKSKARQMACDVLASLSDREAKAILLAVADDADDDLYRSALGALATIFGQEVGAELTAALQSRHSSVRGKAAALLAQTKLTASSAALVNAYRGEKDKRAGEEMVSALISLGVSDPALVPFLIERLAPERNSLWFQDVRLLRHLTGEKFGPEHEWSLGGKKREAELEKWRQWWAARKAAANPK
jgi:HEAT repeat protein